MNRMMIIIIIVALLLLAGGAGAFVMMKKTPTNSKTATQNTVPQVSPKNQIEKKSFKDFMNLSTNQKCTFADTTTGNSGVVYTSSGKVRGDFISVVNGSETRSHMMSDGEFVYTWSDGQKQGFKMSLEAMEEFQPNSETQQNTVDINKQVDYECSNSSVDSNLFTTPSTVQFQDYSSMMENLKTIPSITGATQNTDMKAAQCAACENLPADSKTQCKSVLKC